MSWLDLLVALRATWRRRDRSSLEQEISRSWGSEVLVTLSVRSGFDLLLSALALPKGSEVLFIPGITIPGMVQIVEAHGLQPVGVDPPSPTQMLPAKLAPFVTPQTRMVVISHLFGTIHKAGDLIREAQALGVLVVEDCAQSFIGSAPTRSLACAWPMGFHGHEVSDVTLSSFGNIKTLTTLGGGVARVRDAKLRSRMREIEAAWPVRSRGQRLWTVFRAVISKLFLTPMLYGLLEAVITMLGLDFDHLIVTYVRGFAKLEYIRQQPTLELLELLLWRLQSQQAAAFEDTSLRSSVSRRRRLAGIVIDRLEKEGIEFVSKGDGTNSWWLLPILCDDPRRMAKELVARGFDATSTTTQLQRVVAAATCKQQALRVSDGQDFMSRVVYLPLTPILREAEAAALAEATLAAREAMRCGAAASQGRPNAGSSLLVSLVGLLFLVWPGLITWFLPSTSTMRSLMCWAAVLGIVVLILVRWLAADKGLKLDPKVLEALPPVVRSEGLEVCKKTPLSVRIDGAVLLTGGTGFVGGGILFSLLARAEELGITKIVLMVRQRSGKSLAERLQKLRDHTMFDEVRETFDKLVVGLEGDTSQRNFGWTEAQPSWPHKESLKAVLHCAGDVRFQQPMQQAAVSLISATLQMQQLASQWKAKRFLFVSTAFVHAVPPPSTEALQERLVELRDFDAMELYRDAMSHGGWAQTAMRELGFPNTYTFCKAVAEHLVIRACDSEGLDVRIVRPSIVGPAWAYPFIGWAGDKPSTIVGAGTLLAKRGVRAFRDAFDHPCPVVPVDMVADISVKALGGAFSSEHGRIFQACLDSSEARQMPSFRFFTAHYFQLLALRGSLSLAELGLMAKLLRWCDNATVFHIVHALINVLPMKLLGLLRICMERIFALVGMRLSKQFSTMVKVLESCCTLPMQYHSFSSPCVPWHFQSTLRLPEQWDFHEYFLICCRAGYAFARPSAGQLLPPGRNYAKEFAEIQIFGPSSVLSDLITAFAHPNAGPLYAIAAFVVRQGLSWLNLTVTVDGASLQSISKLDVPLVLCPQHRSVLDFVIIGLTCFQLQPVLPALQLPQVAADAEFSGLPFLGWALAGLGAFFVRRGGGSVQPDPALRAKVGKVFRSGRPLEVFLEGLRSRGRRQLRLRTGLLKALRDISQRTVALVPLAMSYELLPEDESLYREICGLPRDPLRTLDLVWWVLRGLRGELPPLGEAFMRFGVLHTLDASANVDSLVSDVQKELVELSSVTTLHCRALGEVLGFDAKEVVASLESQVPLRNSCVPDKPGPMSPAECWPLVLQAATLSPIRRRLPRHWGRWLVEGLAEDVANGKETGAQGESELASGALDLAALAGAFESHLLAAEKAAEQASDVLRQSGTVEITEEHLVQQLLSHEMPQVPPPLAQGAAAIVASRFKSTRSVGASVKGKQPVRGSVAPVTPLWPAHEADQLKNEESLDRWGFKDTKFVAQYVDGKPAAQISSQRYKAFGRQPLFRLWDLFQRQLAVPLNVRDMIADRPMPELPKPAEGLEEVLRKVLPSGRAHFDAESRIRAGTGHGLADIWRLRTRQMVRFADAVVSPISEEEVQALLKAAVDFNHGKGFGVIPVGGRTNVTSATLCPPKEVDPRPFVALDMRGLASVLWVNAEDGVAMIEAGITGMNLKDALKQHGVTMGMEPDSMELSTLGGWIATRASGMKRARYGNIEDMVLEVRVVTPTGPIWQRHGDPRVPAQSQTAIGRASTNIGLPALVLGSEGCLGIITSAVVRVRPLPEVVEYQSIVFPDWDRGAAWMREVARMPAGLRPASCRLMDQNQLELAQALKEGSEQKTASSNLRASLREAYLYCKGVSLAQASAATLVFEGTHAEVKLQMKEVSKLVSKAGGIWGGASSGAAGYTLTFAIAYLRDFGLDYRILAESLETMAPWSAIHQVWPKVTASVARKHRELCLPGRPFMSCRMTQLYDEGGVLYMYIAVCTNGLEPKRALEAFESLEHTAREAILDAGGCLSHHHGVGKLRAALLPQTQSPALTQVLRDFKTALDPSNVLAAGNGIWAASPAEDSDDLHSIESEPLQPSMS
ncbi:ads-1 [Symbiodinium sp. CCMP2456]|nr:ads-1 [Symbiodinium sp. CCMP2456]